MTCELRPHDIVMHSLEIIYFLSDGLLFASSWLYSSSFLSHHIAQNEQVLTVFLETMKGGEMASINQMNTGTVSKAALGKRLRYGWRAYGPFLHCRPTYIVIKTSL